MSRALAVSGLVKRFGKKIAIDGLTFEVACGEIVALLGPNGAGKSTTFACLAGLARPDAGTIRFDGRLLESDRGRTVAVIPETPEVYPLLTVWEHLVFVARLCRLDAAGKNAVRNCSRASRCSTNAIRSATRSRKGCARKR